MIRYLDAMEEEQKYVKYKFLGKYDLINEEAKINLYINKTTAIMKCYYETNYYREKDININNRNTISKCL